MINYHGFHPVGVLYTNGEEFSLGGASKIREFRIFDEGLLTVYEDEWRGAVFVPWHGVEYIDLEEAPKIEVRPKTPARRSFWSRWF